MYQPRDAARLVTQAEIDNGERAGTTSSEAARVAESEREVRELRRANAILTGCLRRGGRCGAP
jgi:hypothetical protein